MFLDCISLTLKQKFVFINIFTEILLISLNLNFKYNMKLFLKNQIQLNFSQIIKKNWGKTIIHNFGFNNTFGKKRFCHDIFKITLQKFILLFLTSIPEYTKRETDFDYLTVAPFFFFLKAPESKLRFIGIILYLAINTINSSLSIRFPYKRPILSFQKKIIKILCISPMKEISILGKILPYHFKPEVNSIFSFFFKVHGKSLEYISFQKDILIQIKYFLKNIKIIQNDPKFFNKDKWNAIFMLTYLNLDNTFFTGTFTSNLIQKRNFSSILKKKEYLKLLDEFTYILTLTLTFQQLKKKSNNFCNIFFFNQKFYLSLKFKIKNIYSQLNWLYFPSLCHNLIAKVLGAIEVKPKNQKYFFSHCLFKNILITFSVVQNQKNVNNKQQRVKIEKRFFDQILNNLFFQYNSISKIIGKKIANYPKNLFGMKKYRVLIFNEKEFNLSIKESTINIFLQKSTSPYYNKLLKKDSIQNFCYRYINFFYYHVSKANEIKLLKQLSFFSRHHFTKKIVFEYFFNSKEKNNLIGILPILFSLFKVSEIKENKLLFGKYYSVKLSKRFSLIKNSLFTLKNFILFYLTVRTQIIGNKIILLYKKINNNWNSKNFLVPTIIPLIFSVYLSIFFQSLKKRMSWSKKLLMFKTIKEDIFFSVFSKFFEMCKFLPNNSLFSMKNKLFSGYSLMFTNFISSMVVFLGGNFSSFKKNQRKFFSDSENFLKFQLNGSFFYLLYTVKTKSNLLDNLSSSKLSSQNIKSNNIRSNLFMKGLSLDHANKKILNILLSIPYKTTLNKKAI